MTKTALFLISAILSGCAFNFDVTSQRTALENQVMGSYKELEDELILSAAMRGDTGTAPANKKALRARQNQMFNADEIRELKDAGLLGEGSDGYLKKISMRKPGSEVPNFLLASLEKLNKQENADREVIWRHMIEDNKNLTAKNLPDIGKSYSRIMQEKTIEGHWFQNESGKWIQK